MDNLMVERLFNAHKETGDQRFLDAVTALENVERDRRNARDRLKQAECLLADIELLIPNWRAYRDLAEAVEVTLVHARQMAGSRW